MKTKLYFILLLAISSAILYSCSSSKDSSGITPQTGDYSFTFSDSAGNKLMDGTITITTAADGKLAGTYRKSAVYDSTFSAYSLLKGGKCSGTYNNKSGEIGINMNPMMADNNVWIGGKINGDIIDGGWSHSTMMGGKQKGKFNATLK